MDILQRLGASEEPSVQRFSIYIPNKDKDRATIADWEEWVDSAIYLLARINGGSTSLPASKSAWKAKDGSILLDDTVVVYSFIRHPDAFEQRFDEITAFIHDFGKTANQESVLVELSDGHRAYFIDESEYL